MSIKERRSFARMEKSYQVFCKSGAVDGIGETLDITDKGVGILANIPAKLGDVIEVKIVPRDEIFFFTCDGVVRSINELGNGNKYKYRIGIEFNEGLKDFASDQLMGDSELIIARTSTVINALQADCYDAISNFESYPKWQKHIKSAKVLERDASGRPVVVEFLLDAIIKSIRFVNKYEYFDKDFIMSWKAAGGDLKVNDGSYVFQKLREGKTNAIFTVNVEFGFYTPKKLLNYFNSIAMRNSIRALKEVSESSALKKK